ncbi:MAG TPA: hypothetical protein DCM86_15705 [Verrucomicrobiales bacterium]|nr:hypothetical protein [Verrucomicrobiales bacterium]
MNRSGISVLFALGLLLGGCVTPVRPVSNAHLLDFLKDGLTTRESVVLELGQPSGLLESGRILTYRVGREPDDGYFVREAGSQTWSQTKYSLVLVFDERKILVHHALVEVR